MIVWSGATFILRWSCYLRGTGNWYDYDDVDDSKNHDDGDNNQGDDGGDDETYYNTFPLYIHRVGAPGADEIIERHLAPLTLFTDY